jgi:hypothetical protein
MGTRKKEPIPNLKHLIGFHSSFNLCHQFQDKNYVLRVMVKMQSLMFCILSQIQISAKRLHNQSFR